MNDYSTQHLTIKELGDQLASCVDEDKRPQTEIAREIGVSVPQLSRAIRHPSSSDRKTIITGLRWYGWEIDTTPRYAVNRSPAPHSYQ